MFFEQLARHAGWTLDVARLAPAHPASVYTAFVDARFEHQRIRDASGSAVDSESTEGPKGSSALSAQEAALDLANVLYGLVEPDSSPEGQLRRGETALDQSTAADPVRLVPEDPDRTTKLLNGPTAAQLKARYAQHPELRTMKLDPYGLADESDNERSAGGSAGTDYQL